MKPIFFFGIILGFMVLLEARRGRDREENSDSKGNRRRSRNRNSTRALKLPLAFLECQDFFSQIVQKKKEMRRNRDMDRPKCESENKAECIMKHIEAARCQVEEKPSPECIKKITDFLEGICPDEEGNENGEEGNENGEEANENEEEGNEDEGVAFDDEKDDEFDEKKGDDLDEDKEVEIL